MASWSCLCSAVLKLASSLLLLRVFTTRFTIRFTIRFTTRFTIRFTIRFTTRFTIGTKILVPRSLGEPVLGDGGTALSGKTN